MCVCVCVILVSVHTFVMSLLVMFLSLRLTFSLPRSFCFFFSLLRAGALRTGATRVAVLCDCVPHSHRRSN